MPFALGMEAAESQIKSPEQAEGEQKVSWEHTPGLGEPPTLSSSHYVQLITHPQLFWVRGVFLSKSCSAIPRQQLLNRWGPWGTCRGILPSIADSLLPPKVGEHLFFLIPLFFSSTTAHKVPGVAACTSLCTAQSYRHTQRKGDCTRVPAGRSPEQGSARHRDRVWCGAAWLQAQREAGLSTWDLWTHNGQGKAAAAPRGSKG